MPTGSEIKLKTLGFKQERPDGPFTGVSLELTNGFRSINYEWDRDVNQYKRISDLSQATIRKVGVKVYSPNNWHMQAYFGIRMYDDKDALIVDEDFGTAESTEVANKDAKWEW